MLLFISWNKQTQLTCLSVPILFDQQSSEDPLTSVFCLQFSWDYYKNVIFILRLWTQSGKKRPNITGK